MLVFWGMGYAADSMAHFFFLLDFDMDSVTKICVSRRKNIPLNHLRLSYRQMCSRN